MTELKIRRIAGWAAAVMILLWMAQFPLYMMGDALGGNPDPSTARTLTMSTMLIYNSSIAFAITGLFLVAAGYASATTGVLRAGAGGSPTRVGDCAQPRCRLYTAWR